MSVVDRSLWTQDGGDRESERCRAQRALRVVVCAAADLVRRAEVVRSWMAEQILRHRGCGLNFPSIPTGRRVSWSRKPSTASRCADRAARGAPARGPRAVHDRPNPGRRSCGARPRRRPRPAVNIVGSAERRRRLITGSTTRSGKHRRLTMVGAAAERSSRGRQDHLHGSPARHTNRGGSGLHPTSNDLPARSQATVASSTTLARVREASRGLTTDFSGIRLPW